MNRIIWLTTLVTAFVTSNVIASTSEFDCQQLSNSRGTLSLNAVAVWQDFDIQVKTGYLKLTERHVTVIQQCLENMKVEDLPHPGTHPDANSPVIRRSWHDYVTTNKDFQSIIFCSGRTGHHSNTFGTQQGQNHYMVDECWFEVHPDAVLNCQQEQEMNYFPTASADLIVFDDQRFFKNEHINLYLRILKPNGTLVFKPGSGMGWPSSNFDNQDWSSDCGRYATKSFAAVRDINNDADKRLQFNKIQLAKADHYYKQRGFKMVEYQQQCFVLKK